MYQLTAFPANARAARIRVDTSHRQEIVGLIYRRRIRLALHDGDTVRLRVEPREQFLVENCLGSIAYLAQDTFHVTSSDDIGAYSGYSTGLVDSYRQRK
jgi:hypothetical protein